MLLRRTAGRGRREVSNLSGVSGISPSGDYKVDQAIAVAEPDVMEKDAFEALVARIASDSDLQTSGQRSLALVEAVIGDRAAPGPARRVLGEPEKAMALARLGLKPREVEAAASVLLRSRSGDIPPEALNRVRKGVNLTCDSLRTQLCAEKRRRRKAKGPQAPPPARQEAKPSQASPKPPKPDRAKKGKPARSLEDEADRILGDAEADTQTRKALALIEAAVAMGLIDPKAGGNKTISRVQGVAVSRLGVKEHEFYSCWIAVRAIATRKLPKSAREVLWNGAVGAGHYENMRKLKRAALTGGWKRRVDDAAIREVVVRAASGNHLFMPTQRALAVLEALSREQILDPSRQVERDLPRAWAQSRDLGIAKTEFDACWAALRAVKLGRLHASAIDYLKVAAETASCLGVEGLRRRVKDGTVKRALGGAARAAAGDAKKPKGTEPELKVKVARPLTLEVVPGPSSAGRLLEVVKEFHAALDVIRLRADQDEDAELSRVVGEFLDATVHMKTRSSRLAARRDVEGGAK